MGLVAAWLAAVALAQPLTLDELLFRANEAVTAYEKQFSSVVAEERYIQRVVRSDGGLERARTLVSDYLMIRLPGQDSWMGFRDVFEVDGKPVRDREVRLQKLFLEGLGEAMGQVAKIARESARYNIGDVQRTINLPTLPLIFLHALNQHRFYFEKAGEERVGDVQAWIVAYSEHVRPTLVRAGRGDIFARGRFWIETAGGRVIRSELILGDNNTQVRSTITVNYRPDQTLGLWVPTDMTEVYQNPRRPEADRIEATATYANFRRFQVKTEETIRPPKEPATIDD